MEPPVEAVAGLTAGVAGVADAASPGADNEDERVLLTVDPDLDQLERLPRCGALLPQLVSRGAPEDGRPCLDRSAQCLIVHVGKEDHLQLVGVQHGAVKPVTSGHYVELRPVLIV